MRSWLSTSAFRPTDGVEVRDGIVPPHGRRPSVRVRVYRPARAGARVGAIVLFHGGGFVAGGLGTDHALAVDYCRGAGCAVVSVDYRLAPEHPFPAAVDDAYAAWCWTAEHADRLGVDTSRLAVGGGSAGGGIAAAVALMARDRRGPRPCLQLLGVPALDDRGRFPSSDLVDPALAFDGPAARRMWRHYLGAAAGSADVPAYAAPGRCEDLRGLPPAYLAVAEADPLRDDGIDYALRLLAAGVPVDLHLYAGSAHGLVAGGRDTPAGARSLDDRLAVLRQAVAPPGLPSGRDAVSEVRAR